MSRFEGTNELNEAKRAAERALRAIWCPGVFDPPVFRRIMDTAMDASANLTDEEKEKINQFWIKGLVNVRIW